MGRRGRRSKELLDDLEDKRGFSKLREEALDHILWRTRFGRATDLSLDYMMTTTMIMMMIMMMMMCTFTRKY
jgi:hypothetical protein